VFDHVSINTGRIRFLAEIALPTRKQKYTVFLILSWIQNIVTVRSSNTVRFFGWQNNTVKSDVPLWTKFHGDMGEQIRNAASKRENSRNERRTQARRNF
jgi:hypothetical protein